MCDPCSKIACAVNNTFISLRSVQEEVKRTDQFKVRSCKGKAAADVDADAEMKDHEERRESDEDDDEPVVKKRPAAKRKSSEDGVSDTASTGRGRGKGRGKGGKKPGSSAPPKAKAKAKGKAADKKAAKAKPDGSGDEPEDDQPDDAQAEGTASPGEVKPPAKKTKAEAATKKAAKPKAAGKAAAKSKGKAGQEEPEPFKEKVFARRPRPNPPQQAMQWQAIRDIFDSHIKPSLRFPSKHEYAWYDKMKALFPTEGTIQDYLNIARGQASDFLKSVSK